MATDTFRLQYLTKTAAGVPRDLVNTFIASKFHAIRPTVLIYNCTWVCDARCTMCSNWKWGDRKSDMTLEQLEPVMNSPFWGAVENLNISGGEPTTRNDLPEMVELFQRHLPRLRKIGINTTSLTPQRAIPMLTRIVEFCAAKGILISIRVSLDGIGDVHNQVRSVKNGFDKAQKTIDAMQALAATHDNFSFGIASTISGRSFRVVGSPPEMFKFSTAPQNGVSSTGSSCASVMSDLRSPHFQLLHIVQRASQTQVQL